MNVSPATDTITDPDSVHVKIAITNLSDSATLFLEYAPYLSYEVIAPDHTWVTPIEGDLVLDGGPNAIDLGAGETIERVVNLACVDYTLRRFSAQNNRDGCYLRYLLASSGDYRVVVHYRAPQVTPDPETDGVLEITSDTAQIRYYPVDP